MAFTFGFFNAQQVNGDYDRKYGADELAEYFSYLIGNGISGDVSNCFKVSAGSGMQIYIEPGYGWINGYWCKSDTRIAKSLSVAPSVGNRFDSVVLRYVRADRKIDIDVVEGEASSTSSSYKQLVRNSDIYEIMLGYVVISAGATAVTQSMIVDTRSNDNLCGIVSTFSQKTLADGSVTNEKLANNSVSYDKLAKNALYSPVNKPTAATYAVQDSDVGKTIVDNYVNRNSAVTWTISKAVLDAFDVGTELAFARTYNTVSVSIALAGARVINRESGQVGSASAAVTFKLPEIGSMCALKKVEQDNSAGSFWVLTGDVEVAS